MSDSSVALGSTGATYSGVCQHRLPCGYCNLRNMMCPVNNFTISAPCKPWWEQVYYTSTSSDQSITGSISGESK